MRKGNFIDAIAGFVAGFILFLGVPLIVFHGSWGLLGYDAVQSIFPSLAGNPQSVLMVLCLAYIILDCVMFLVYRELPFYKKRHHGGVEQFLFALGSFLVGAMVSYCAIAVFGLLILGGSGGASL